jgi:UPF0755 protein
MKKYKVLVILLLVGSVLLTSFLFYGYQMVYAPNLLVEKPDRYLDIHSTMTFRDLQNTLYDEGYVNDPVSFSFLARLMKYDRLMKPGHYRIRQNASNIETIRMLRAGMQVPVNITFNNVRLLSELSEKICANIELEPAAFDQLLRNEDIHEAYGFSKETFRSMFIPNTYQVYWTIKARELLDRLHLEYNNFWNSQRLEKASAIGLTPVEVSILASIVEAETKHYVESPTIAGLYLNRLKKGIRLQADPTLVYAVGDFTIQRVLNVHKEIESPYNTYKYAGLPPGPINLPSIRSIDAVLNYEKHNYLYMCAKDDFSGYHYFSQSLRAHLNYARRYQQALNQAKLYK